MGVLTAVDVATVDEVQHKHTFGPFEVSRLAGTVHRKCATLGCKVVAIDIDDA